MPHNNPEEEEESGPEDQEIPRRLALTDEAGNPIGFFIHKSVRDPWIRHNLTADIKKHGGKVQPNDKNVDTVIVSRDFDKEKLQRVYNADISDDQSFRDTWVEPVSFIQHCIRDGQVRHLLPARKRMGGTIGGRSHFTPEEDDLLARYIAVTIPDKEEGGRRGEELYQQLEEMSRTDDRFAWARRHTGQSWRNRYNKNMERFDHMVANYVHRLKPTDKQRYARYRQPYWQRGLKDAYFDEQVGDEEIEDQEYEAPPPAKKRRLSGSPRRSPGKERANDPQEERDGEDNHYRSLFGESERDESGPSTKRRASLVTNASSNRPALQSSPPPPFSTLPQNPIAEARRASIPNEHTAQQSQSQQRTASAALATVANDAPDVPSTAIAAYRTSGGLHSPLAPKLPADSQHESTAAVASQIPPAPLHQRSRAIKRPSRPKQQPVAPTASPYVPPYRNTRSRSRSVEPSVERPRPKPGRKASGKGKAKEVVVIGDFPGLAPLEEQAGEEEDDMRILSLDEAITFSAVEAQTQTLEEELDVEELLVNNISAHTTHVSNSEEAQDPVNRELSRSPSSSSSGLSGIGTPPPDKDEEDVPMDSDDAQTHQSLQHPLATAPGPASQHPTSIFNPDEDEEMLQNFMARLPRSTVRSPNRSNLRPTPIPFSRTYAVTNEVARRPRNSASGPSRLVRGDPFRTALTPPSVGPEVWIQSEAAQVQQVKVRMARRGSEVSIASVESFPVVGTKASAVKKWLEAEEKRTPYKPPSGTRAAGFRQK